MKGTDAKSAWFSKKEGMQMVAFHTNGASRVSALETGIADVRGLK
jgi:hypothetical protein